MRTRLYLSCCDTEVNSPTHCCRLLLFYSRMRTPSPLLYDWGLQIGIRSPLFDRRVCASRCELFTFYLTFLQPADFPLSLPHFFFFFLFFFFFFLLHFCTLQEAWSLAIVSRQVDKSTAISLCLFLSTSLLFHCACVRENDAREIIIQPQLPTEKFYCTG